MTGAAIREALADPRAPFTTADAVRRVMAARRTFGITRLGAVTGLDRLGIPVMQAIRPASLSNAVAQGKGPTRERAAISALMECLESWSGERIAAERIWSALPDGATADGLWSALFRRMPATGRSEPIRWIEGWDLLAERTVPVPLALVDTVYTFPSPHAAWLPRDTTGLAAGTSLRQAARHALFELMERAACHLARRKPHFFDRNAVDPTGVTRGEAEDLVARIRGAGFAIGIWRVPAPHVFPVYWCQIMEPADALELAPFPAEGFGCGATRDEALSKALLEACQSRLTVIAGARDDVAARLYAERFDRAALDAWRARLGLGGAPFGSEAIASSDGDGLAPLVEGLAAAGAQAVILVPLVLDPALPFVALRALAPPLATNPDGD